MVQDLFSSGEGSSSSSSSLDRQITKNPTVRRILAIMVRMMSMKT